MIQRILPLVCIAASLAAVEHPPLFLSDERAAEIREAVGEKDTHHHLAETLMRQRVEAGTLDAYGGGNNGYRRSYKAREAALLSRIVGDDATRKKYADIAFEALKGVYGEGQDRVPDDGYGLSRAMMSMGFGIAYDWCHDVWSDEQRAWVEGKIDTALAKWPKYGHANLGHARASNWVAVCRGGELVLLLCRGRDETDEGAKRRDKLIKELKRHIDAAFGDLGMCQEGIGYTEYPGGFLLPAILAAREAGDETLWNAAQKKKWWKGAMYGESFQGEERKFIMHGVAHTSNFNEGWTSLLHAFVPDEEKPYYMWFYDRHMGRRSNMSAVHIFDGQRAGTVWAMVYYPEDVEAEDPTGVYPPLAVDSHGFNLFRNRWQDEDDILASVMSDTKWHSHSWDMAEALAINVMAANSRYFGGPGKKRRVPDHSTLLVDGRPYKGGKGLGRRGEANGEQIATGSTDHGAYVVVGGGKQYRAMGVDDVHRHMVADFSLGDGRGLISTLDLITSSKEHTYTWQGNLGAEKESRDSLEVGVRPEGGRPSFLIRGRDEGFLKGWVLHPADAELSADGDPVRIETAGTDAQIWVAFVVGSGNPPEARIEGEGLGTTLTVGGTTLSYDPDAKGMVAESDAGKISRPE